MMMSSNQGERRICVLFIDITECEIWRTVTRLSRRLLGMTVLGWRYCRQATFFVSRLLRCEFALHIRTICEWFDEQSMEINEKKEN